MLAARVKLYLRPNLWNYLIAITQQLSTAWLAAVCGGLNKGKESSWVSLRSSDLLVGRPNNAQKKPELTKRCNIHVGM